MCEAFIGLVGVIVGALINRYTSIKAQRVAADANIRHLMSAKAHDSIVSAIKVLTYRLNICNDLLDLIVDDSTEERV